MTKDKKKSIWDDEEFMEDVSQLVEKQGDFVIDHKKMKFPEELSEFDYSNAIKKSKAKKTAYLKKEFWKNYRNDLRERLKGKKRLQLGFDWNVLFYELDKRINDLKAEIIREKNEGIHPTKGDESGLKKTPKEIYNTRVKRVKRVDEIRNSLKCTYPKAISIFNKEMGEEIYNGYASFNAQRNKVINNN